MAVLSVRQQRFLDGAGFVLLMLALGVAFYLTAWHIRDGYQLEHFSAASTETRESKWYATGYGSFNYNSSTPPGEDDE